MRYKFKSKYKKKIIYDQTINFFAMTLIIILIFFAHKFSFSSGDLLFSCNQKNISAFDMPYQNLLTIKNLSQKYNLSFYELITLYSLENNFFKQKYISDNPIELEKDLILNYKQIKKKYRPNLIKKYQNLYKNLIQEIKFFPVPKNISADNYIFYNNWEKNYKNKIPNGCDIFDRENISGRIPIISITDGIISQINWNDQKGYNLSIKSPNNNIYLYCHLEKFADGLEKNLKIKSGTLLGYMGNTQKKDTQKSVHLHLSIKTNLKNKFLSQDFYINPYLFLRLIQDQNLKSKK